MRKIKKVIGIGKDANDKCLVIVFNIKKFQNTIDKIQKMCYNISTRVWERN